MVKFRKKEESYEFDIAAEIERHADMVYRIAIVQMKNKADAEDVFQEVFLRLVQYRQTIESAEHLKAWLIRVTINCCRKEFDKAARKHEVSAENENGIMENGKCDTYQVEESNGELIQAVRNLPENYSSVIHLFYFEEYSVKEISQILEVSESSVKTRLSRARDMLRKSVKEHQQRGIRYAGTI